MALQNAGLITLFPTDRVSLVISSSYTVTLDGSGDAIMSIFIASAGSGSLTIDQIGVPVETVSASAPPTYIVGIEGVSDGRVPNGTYEGGGSPASGTYAGASWSTGWNVIDLDNPITLTEGTEYAVTIRYSTGTIGASNNIAIPTRRRTDWDYTGPGVPYAQASADGGTTWTVESDRRTASLAPIDTNGNVPFGFCPYTELTENSWDMNDTPLHRGNYFTPPCDMRMVGYQLSMYTAVDWECRLYAPSGIVSAATVAVDADQGWGSAGTDNAIVPCAPTTLTGGTKYRVVVTPTTASNITVFSEVGFGSAAARRAVSGEGIASTTASGTPTSEGNWTDDDTELYAISPVIDQIDDGAGGGGGGLITHAGVLGGARG